MNQILWVVFRQQGLRFSASGTQQALQSLDVVLENDDDAFLQDSAASWRDSMVAWLQGWLVGKSLPAPSVDWTSVSPFTAEVLQKLWELPFGQVCSYSDLAQQLGRPSAVRAVASAVGKNPFLILIPCHRVLAKGGRLGGFRGGLPLKRHLLHREGILLTA